MNEDVTLRFEADTAWITLDDGKANALDTARLDAIGAALEEAEAAGAVTVLTGREGILSAGFDLTTFQRGLEASIEMLEAGARLLERLLRHPRPVVTACTGHAYPMGAFLMLAADVRYGIVGDYRIGMNETAIGLTVPEFALALAKHRLAPSAYARVTTAKMFDPAGAIAAGYLDYVVPPEELVRAVTHEAERLATLDGEAFRGTKARIHGPAADAIRDAAERERVRLTGSG